MKITLILFSITYVISRLFCNIVFYEFCDHFNNLSFNDSIEFLCIISSSIYTLFFLNFLIVCRYIYHVRNLSNKMLSLFSLYNYFLSSNCFTNISLHIFKTTKMNLNLQNGLLNIHPYIIYVLYSWVFIYLYNNLFKQKCFLHVFRNGLTLIILSYLIFCGILLGAWWAAQEFNWGGFWSWDPVELISLLVFIYIISILHNPNNIYKSTTALLYLLIVVTIYFIMRLGVVTTVHSFIKNLTMPFYAYIMYSGVLVLLFKYFYKHVQLYKLQSSCYIYIKNMIPFFIKTLLQTLVFTVVLLICVNLNLVRNMFLVPLNYVYINMLYLFLIIYLIKDRRFYHNLLIFLWFVFIVFLMQNYTVLLFYFYTIFSVRKKNHNLLHFLFLWVYTVYTYFFVPFLQYSYTQTLYLPQHVLTDYYTNANIWGYYESAQFFKKNYYLTAYKTQLQHISSFTTVSNNILTYFTVVKNNQIYLIYSEEFTLLVLYIFTIFIFYIFRKFYTNRLAFY